MGIDKWIESVDGWMNCCWCWWLWACWTHECLADICDFVLVFFFFCFCFCFSVCCTCFDRRTTSVSFPNTRHWSSQVVYHFSRVLSGQVMPKFLKKYVIWLEFNRQKWLGFSEVVGVGYTWEKILIKKISGHINQPLTSLKNIWQPKVVETITSTRIILEFMPNLRIAK